MISLLFLTFLALSVAGYAAATFALGQVSRRSRRPGWNCFTPRVSIVKPLSGLDDDLEQNLESFYRLDYPEYEVVFSFARRTDPAFEVARRVADRHPSIPSTFVVDAREAGANAKVNRLAAGIERTRFRYILMADGNVRVGPQFLSRAVGPFANGSVGLVSHLFSARGARTLASRLESLYLNGVLSPGTAALAELLRMPCVVGKSILISRDALNSIGGVAVLRDFLAEDFLMGKLVASAGYQVRLCADRVDTAEISRSLSASWSRQRRWAILRKRLGGAAYGGELASNSLPWFVGAAVTGGGRIVLLALALYAIRVALEAVGLIRARSLRPMDVLLIPVRDLAALALFWAGLFGGTTHWRGRKLRVGPATVLLPVRSESISFRVLITERN
jgi:ceramide glucosyltransferase